MPAFVTAILTLAAELLRAAGDVKAAKKVDEILKSRPRLAAVESKAFKRALDRLGRRPS